METKRLFRRFALIWILAYALVSATAQPSKAENDTDRYPFTAPSFYIGAEGGYLFSNKDFAENPAYYLNHGYFTELQLGWKSRPNWLGWQLNAGRISLSRQVTMADGNIADFNGYDVLQSTNPNWMWQENVRDDKAFMFDQAAVDTSATTNFNAWYAMTGPQFWLGKQRFQASLSLNAGVGLTDIGYYFVQGHGAATNTLPYDYYSQANNQVVGPVEVQLKGDFVQYGLSQKTYTDAGSPGDFKTADIKTRSAINFMAKGALNLEYFVNSRISVNASASYWYVMMPDMASQQQFHGQLLYDGKWNEEFKPSAPGKDPFLDPKNRTINGGADFSYRKDFNKKNLGLLSTSIGLKFWLGKKHKAKTMVKIPPPPVPAPVLQQAQKKDLLITVKDKPTGYALSSVKVTVFKNGQPFYTGITDANGALPVIKDIPAGNYAIVGILNGVKTNINELTKTDFSTDNRMVNCELLHNDPRFTLIGHTINAQTSNRIAHVKTMLTQNKGGENSAQVSDNNGEFRFQLQPNTDYTVYAAQKGYFSNRANITTKGLDRSKTLYVDLRLSMNELKQGTHFELKDIYYDFDKSDIRADAGKILDNLYRMLIDNPTVFIELSSYTDSRGSDSYNLRLSQQRAASAVRYLVNKGIAASRLQAKGYGETRPVNGCINGVPCTEQEHQANRRTEIKILKE